MGLFDNPGFYVTYALVQAVVLLYLIRFLDLYERKPVGLIVVMAMWGATGAAALALAGDRLVEGVLSGDIGEVFGNAISVPFVEEIAKGAALLVVLLVSRPIARRLGVSIFSGVNDGIVYGAAIGLGFAFTEDFFYFIDKVRDSGVTAGSSLFLYRRDFLGPAVLHHAFFTAALGAALGLAVWSTSRVRRIVLPLLGLGFAILMHAVNNGLVELTIVLRHGMPAASDWVSGADVQPDVASTAETTVDILSVIDALYVLAFLLAIAFWLRHQKRVIQGELVEETQSGLISGDDAAIASGFWRRSSRYWRLLRARELDQWQHERRLHGTIVDLALLKWRTRHWQGDWGAVMRLRRKLATIATFEPRPTNLPKAGTALLGRERELRSVRELLEARDTRLVTLTGPGGTGKTRLAIEVAEQERDAFPAGVFFVSLAAVMDPAHVPVRIAEALSVREVGGESAADRLEDHLRDKQLLLVLDNFEQVVAAAPLVRELLSAAPRLKVLATSRQPLRLAGEREQEVTPLAIPDATALQVDHAASYGAIALFVERARAVSPAFRLTPEVVGEVAAICRRLDGLPLAIELAAAQTRTLTPPEMLRRLDDRLSLTLQGARDLPQRQQTLEATIEWSYELLEEPDRLLFAGLAVFSGGFTLNSAEAICGPRTTQTDMLPLITSLVEKSLVRREENRAGSRFAMLETIRAYAARRLDEGGDLETLYARHAAHFADIAAAAETGLEGRTQGEWVERLDADRDNVLAAAARAIEAGDNDLALRLLVPLTRFWERRSLAEPRKLLDAALAGEGDVPVEARARGLRAAGRLALLQSDYAAAVAVLEQALTLFRQRGSDHGTLECLWDLGWIELVRGTHTRSRELSKEALELSQRSGERAGVARSLLNLGRRETEYGDVSRARTLLEESLELRRTLGDERQVANSLSALSRAALVAGDSHRAETLAGDALHVARRLDDQLREAEALYFLALAKLDREDEDEVADLIRERLVICRELGDTLGTAECLDALACVDAASNEAPLLLGAADSLRKRIGASPWPLERLRRERREEELRQTLGQEVFQAEFEHGLSLSGERASLLALGNAEPPAGRTPTWKESDAAAV